ncbi:unnamed protein product [Mytilus coruscus]|uniref:Reverse transcriptase domain-containing protein n=1 Tax=Mytilus coruscus TaxID=42192 RepID=A0A6J8AKF4_MYTCO|nr:unnamed protein product [Mytilus coruscus]
MKIWYDKDARDRVFEPGDKVLVFLPVPGHPLQAKYCGPYTIESKINDLNYIVKTPGRRKQNRVRGESKPVATLAMVKLENNHDKPDIIEPPFSSKTMEETVRLKNSEILSNLDSKLAHLSFDHVPNKTTAVCHDVDVGDASPIKQHPYRLNPLKLEFMRKEIKYMLDNDIIEPSYWQVPLTQRAREISAFVTPDGLFQYTVMPFGMKSAPATFQRMINNVIKDLDCCYAYIDDLIVCSDSWEEHLTHLYDTFDRLSQSNLTVNLGKSEFCQATVDYLGHTVGQSETYYG